jgi:hypothetical protein
MCANNPDLERAAFIEQFGWAVVLVSEKVPYGYTVGVSKTFGDPELFICGLHPEDIHHICNLYGQAVKEGAQFKHGDEVTRWLDSDAPLKLTKVHPKWMPVFMGKVVDDLGEATPALQALWPAAGAYPLDPHWPEQLAGRQFVLA